MLKFVRISGLMCIGAPDAPNSLFLQRIYLLIVNNNKQIFYLLLLNECNKDTSQHAFLIIYFI